MLARKNRKKESKAPRASKKEQKERKKGRPRKRVGTLKKERENAMRVARPLRAVGAACEVVHERDKRRVRAVVHEDRGERERRVWCRVHSNTDPVRQPRALACCGCVRERMLGCWWCARMLLVEINNSPPGPRATKIEHFATRQRGAGMAMWISDSVHSGGRWC